MENYTLDYSCGHCGENISHMTKRLQESSSAEMWKKHGSCCVSCVSQKKTFISSVSAGKGEELHDSGNYIVSQANDSGMDHFLPNEVAGNKTTDNTTLVSNGRLPILCGKIISAIGVISALSFFYTEINLLVFAGLPLTLSGIVICRYGIRRKRNTLKLIRESSENRRP